MWVSWLVCLGLGRDSGVEELDAEELGRTIELLYNAFQGVESVGGSLSPFVPTQEYVEEPIVVLLEAFLERMRRIRGNPVFYEPGCGNAKVTGHVASRGYYAVCLELDEDLTRTASEATRGLLVDVVRGDLATFTLRRADVAYAYLLPRAVRLVLEALSGRGTVLLSLDYPAEGDKGQVMVTELRIMHRGVYVYKA
jgi:SAM-dependent methyltransferase